ncbi:MAG: Tricorn protease [Anaerolineales bacterium]|nr:Tricorn protease [Anaerolineales bacterium]
MTEPGYYRFPTIYGDAVVFVCEDDLWTVPASGGIARRLTSNLGQASMPAFSPDGEILAFTGRDEGHPEVCVMPAEGGPAERLTYLGASSSIVGWTPDGDSIVFASNSAQPFSRLYNLYAVSHAGGEPEGLPTGPALSISYGPDGGRVIGRNTTDLARWKRYRGGLTGDLWIDPDGGGEWRRLIDLEGNVALPLWVGERIYFISDHEGIGNLYSCSPAGEDLRRYTHHEEYYVRHPSTDGQRIVYHAGAELHIFDPALDETQRIDVEFRSPRVQRKRKFVDSNRYLQDYAIHPEGHSVAVVSRGKPFTMANWEGAVIQHGEPNGTRYRLASWLKDGERLVVVSDAAGEEALEIHHADAGEEPERLDDLDIGRPIGLVVSPQADQVALANHRNELMLVDLEERTVKVLDHSRHSRIRGIDWSPDGRWIAYGFFDTQQTSIIKLCRVETGETWPVTEPVLRDVAPAFDPEGKYLYFLSYREFDPVYDNLHFDLTFLWGMRPYLVTLRADLPSPFVPVPRAPGEKLSDADSDNGDDGDNGDDSDNADDGEPNPGGDGEDAAEDGQDENEKKDEEQIVEIDVDGITERVIAFPVSAGRFGRIQGIKGKVLFSVYPVEGSADQSWDSDSAPPAKGKLVVYNFESQDDDVLINGITAFDVSMNGKALIYRAGNRLRVLQAGKKPGNSNWSPSRKTGWLDLNRIKVSVQPQSEWEQMFREAWRLQRDQFWTEDMSGVDWQAVYQRYLPLVRRIATRSEFSDLMWEMQGELGTSHAYEFGGDYPPEPSYDQGFLGADLEYDPDTDSWRVTHIVHGDVWDAATSSPLAKPGVNVEPGDRLVAVNGRRVSREPSPQELLVNQASNEVLLTFAGDDGEEPRTVSVKTLRSETPARYREWVDANRRRVHAATDGRVGYLHIPDMGPHGYAEFHRGYLAEVNREGLIVDVRFNGGGHVSQLILEKLARRRLGYDVQRWGEPIPYPAESAMGPMVAVCNEQAGSDGDMFTHAFKMMDLGPLIGKRTWGGVIGISFNESLVDGGITTQPEYSFWFKDVGWGLENYGTEPDIEVEISPQAYVAGEDPQLERALEEIQQALAENPPEIPDFDDKPRLGLPALPD